jgi:hypothetical protein
LATLDAQHIELADKITEDDCAVAGNWALKLCLNLRQHIAASHNNKVVIKETPPPLKHVCYDALRVGTIESLHCGDGAVDDARFLGRDVNGNAAVNAHRSLDGLASSLGVSVS